MADINHTASEWSEWKTLAARLRMLLYVWRAHAALRGLLAAACLLCVPVFAGVSLGVFGVARPVLLCIAAVAGAGALLAGFFWPIVRPLRLLDAAFLMERKTPGFKGRVSAAAGLMTSGPETISGSDPDMVASLLKEAAQQAAGAAISSIVTPGPTIKIAAVAIILLGASTGLLHAFNVGPNDVSAYVSPPYLPEPERFELTSTTGDVTAPVGGDIELIVTARGNFSGRPQLVLEREGLDPYTRELEEIMQAGGGDRTFHAQIASIAGDTNYRVSYEKFMSEEFHIFAVEPPRIKNMKMQIEYPEHTGILPDTRDSGGDLRVPFGSKIKFEIEASSELSSAAIVVADASDIPLSLAAESGATGEITVEENIRYSIKLVDVHGFENRFPPEFSIESVPDGNPEITLVYPDEDLTMSRVSAVRVKGDASDDYSVDRVRLHQKISGSEKWTSIPIPVEKGREVLFEYTWDLGAVDAYEGDTIEYRLSASDNDRLTGPKTAYSATRKIHLLSRFDDYVEAEKEQEDIIERMQSTVREGEMISEKFKDLAMSMDKSAEGSKKWKADAERTLDRQQTLEKELGDLSSSMQESIERMKNNELVNLESLATMQEINRLMSEIVTDEMRELIEQIRKSVDQMDPNKIDKELVNRMKDQDKIMKSLQQTLDRLKRIKAEQQMDALKEQLEQLAKREENLLERTENLDESSSGDKLEGREKTEAARQAREQEKIKNESDSAMASMEQLQEEMKELSPDAAREMQRMAEMAQKDKMLGNMDDARKQLSTNSPGEAVPKEKKALKSLQQMSSGFNSMSSSFKQKADQETKDLIRKLLVRTLDTSEGHEETLSRAELIMSRQNTAIPEAERKKIVAEEIIAQEAADFLQRDLARLAVMTMALSPRAPGLANEIYEHLDIAVSSYADNNPAKALTHQRIAANKFNQLALALIDAKNKAGMPMPQSAMDQFMKQLQSLAESQSRLNSMTQSFSESGIPIPGMDGDPLQGLAAQQKIIGDGLGQLYDEMGRMSEMGERVEQIREEMEEVRRALAGGSADENVRRRQANVLRRLQDASLSLRKEVLEENRVAEEAKDYEAGPSPEVRDLLKDALPQDIREELERMRKEPRPKGYERLIEKYYNELMRGAP